MPAAGFLPDGLSSETDSSHLSSQRLTGSSAHQIRRGSYPALPQLDDVLGQAHAVSHNLGDQRKLFDASGLKLQGLTARFPAINGLLNSIKRRKNRVRRPAACNQAADPTFPAGSRGQGVCCTVPAHLPSVSRWRSDAVSAQRLPAATQLWLCRTRSSCRPSSSAAACSCSSTGGASSQGRCCRPMLGCPAVQETTCTVATERAGVRQAVDDFGWLCMQGEECSKRHLQPGWRSGERETSARQLGRSTWTASRAATAGALGPPGRQDKTVASWQVVISPLQTASRHRTCGACFQVFLALAGWLRDSLHPAHELCVT